MNEPRIANSALIAKVNLLWQFLTQRDKVGVVSHRFCRCKNIFLPCSSCLLSAEIAGGGGCRVRCNIRRNLFARNYFEGLLDKNGLKFS